MTDSIQHRHVVGVLLLNEQGQILLQQRDDKPNLRYPGYWTFFGGAVEEGESPDAAVKRELIEELELELDLTFWKSYECPARTTHGQVVTTNHVYIGIVNRPLETIPLHEGQAMRYFAPHETETIELAFMQSPVLASFWSAKERLGF